MPSSLAPGDNAAMQPINDEDLGTPPGFERSGVVVTAQEAASRMGFPLIQPLGRGRGEEMRLICSDVVPDLPCDFMVYYPDGWYLWIIPLRPTDKMSRDWQQDWAENDDPLGIYTLVTVQGEAAVGREQNLGDESYPDGWPGFIIWYDPMRRWLIHLAGSYDLQTLVDMANGPWCTLATPAGMEPLVPFC